MGKIKEGVVFISRVQGLSSFAAINAGKLPETKDKIGSSVKAVNRMLANDEEMKVYLKSVIGTSTNSQDWDKNLAWYWNSYSVNIPETGKKLDISFEYNDEKGLKEFEKLEDAIESEYVERIKSGMDEDEAFRLKDEAIVKLEEEHYKYGKPVNINDYLLWRYCLVYRDCANREQDTRKSAHIRFFLTNKQEEQKRKEAMFKLRSKANSKYHELLPKEDVITHILNANGTSTVGMNSIDKQMALESFKDLKPQDFLAICDDKHLEQKAFIENCITNGLLKRLPNTTTVMDTENNTLGYKIEEVISYIEDPTHKSIVNTLEARLKSLNKTK